MAYNPIDKLFGSKPKEPNTQQYIDANGRLVDEYGDYVDSQEQYIPKEYEKLDPNSLSKLGPSAMEGVTTDPAYKNAQMNALKRLQEVGDKGYTVEEESAMNKIRRDNAQADRGRREAIMASRQARGVGGSGDELAAQMMSNQAANEGNSQEGLDVAANAQRRALAAMAQSGQMAGQMRGQEFGEKSDVARAKDAVNQFNTNNSVRAQFQNNQGQNQFNQQTFQDHVAMAGLKGNATQMRYDQNTDNANRQLAQWQAKNAAREARKRAAFGFAGGAGGAFMGGMAGGPQGAAYGAQAGSSMGQGAGAMFSHGGKVQGNEVVDGDSELNDVIPAHLSADEIVIPRSISHDHKKAGQYVEMVNKLDAGPEDGDLLDRILASINKGK